MKILLALTAPVRLVSAFIRGLWESGEVFSTFYFDRRTNAAYDKGYTLGRLMRHTLKP